MNEIERTILTPVGRFVQGDLFKPNDKDFHGKPLTDKHGAPRVQYFFAIAIPKAEFDPVWSAMIAVAQAGFPAGDYNKPTFSWKYIDGDTPENINKPGFKGHYVIRCTTGFPLTVYGKDGETKLNSEQIKRGDWIRAYISMTPNFNAEKPGLYINPVPSAAVQFVYFGEAIVSGPDGKQVFGAAPVTSAMPQGASDTPLASGPAPSLPGAQAPAMPGAQAPALPGAQAPAMPGAQAPAMPGAQAPAMPGAQAPAMPQKVMTQKSQGYTYEQMIALGWTDQQLLDNGMMIVASPGITPDDIPF